MEIKFKKYEVERSADGTTYTVQYNNTFIISGNNYFKSFDTLQKVNGQVVGLKAVNNKEAWVVGLNYLAVFKNNQPDTIIHVPFDIFYIYEHCYADSLMIFSNSSDGFIS